MCVCCALRFMACGHKVSRWAVRDTQLCDSQCLELLRALLVDPPCDHLSLLNYCLYVNAWRWHPSILYILFPDSTGVLYSCLSCKLPRFVYSPVAGDILSNGLLSSLHLTRQSEDNIARFGGKRIWVLNSKTLLFYILLEGPAAVMLQTVD